LATIKDVISGDVNQEGLQFWALGKNAGSRGIDSFGEFRFGFGFVYSGISSCIDNYLRL